MKYYDIELPLPGKLYRFMGLPSQLPIWNSPEWATEQNRVTRDRQTLGYLLPKQLYLVVSVDTTTMTGTEPIRIKVARPGQLGYTFWWPTTYLTHRFIPVLESTNP